jgi:predicted protein tyrosine phosphatase
MTNTLFICNQNENRSKTAEELTPGSKSAGLYSEKSPVTEELVKWAEVIVVFSQKQVEEVKKRFPKLAFEKRIFNLDIVDIYNYTDERLVNEVKEKLKGIKEFI